MVRTANMVKQHYKMKIGNNTTIGVSQGRYNFHCPFTPLKHFDSERQGKLFVKLHCKKCPSCSVNKPRKILLGDDDRPITTKSQNQIF